MAERVTKYFIGKVRSINPETHTAEVVISDETKDRYDERVLVGSFKKTKKDFMRHPILLSSHAYRGLMNQLGVFTKLNIDEKEKEVVAVAQWFVGEGNPEADWGWKLAEHGVAAFSIGFIPKVYKNYDDGARATNGGIWRDYEEIELLEVSQVLIPANPSALQKSFGDVGEDDCFMKELSEKLYNIFKDVNEEDKGVEWESKGVIPYAKHELAEEGTSWDASKEVKAASVDDLKKMCTWYNGDGKKKGDYKLPHHTQVGYKTVWRGVANAASRLPQASIPSSDVAGCKKHLSGHYKDFGKEAPWDAKKELWEKYEKGENLEETEFKELFGFSAEELKEEVDSTNDKEMDIYAMIDKAVAEAIVDISEKQAKSASEIEKLTSLIENLGTELKTLADSVQKKEDTPATPPEEKDPTDKTALDDTIMKDILGEEKIAELKSILFSHSSSDIDTEGLKKEFEDMMKEVNDIFSGQRKRNGQTV